MNEGLNVGKICESAAHSSDITSCHFSKNGVLATSSSDHTVKLWALKNKELKEIATLKGHKYGVNFCRFSPQGTLLASASTDSTTIIWDVKTGDNLCCLVQPSGFAVRVCQFCPHSSFLATAGWFLIFKHRVWQSYVLKCRHFKKVMDLLDPKLLSKMPRQ